VKKLICCFLPDELVFTKNGVEKISEIKKDDLVLDGNGNYVKVLKKSKHNYSGLINQIRVSGEKPISFIEEHPIFIQDDHKTSPIHVSFAKNIRKGTRLFFIKNKK